MHNRVVVIILLLLVVLCLALLLHKGRREEPALANVPVGMINIPPVKSEPPSVEKEKALAETSDLVDLDKGNFTQFINSETPAVVDFWATTCTACRMLEPVLREVASEMKGKMKFAKFLIDSKENWTIAEKFSIKATPTLVVFKNGKELGRILGYKGKEELKNALENFL